MLSFITEELIQTICREREDEARRVRPHTERQPDPERTTHESAQRRASPLWSAAVLRRGIFRAHS